MGGGTGDGTWGLRQALCHLTGPLALWRPFLTPPSHSTFYSPDTLALGQWTTLFSWSSSIIVHQNIVIAMFHVQRVSSGVAFSVDVGSNLFFYFLSVDLHNCYLIMLSPGFLICSSIGLLCESNCIISAPNELHLLLFPAKLGPPRKLSPSDKQKEDLRHVYEM